MRRGTCYSRPSSYGYADSETPIFGHGTLFHVAARVAYPLTRHSSTDTSVSSRRCLSRVLLRHWQNVHPTDPCTWYLVAPPRHLVFDRPVSSRNKLSRCVGIWFDIEQRSSKRLPLGHQTPPPHPAQSAQPPFIHLLTASTIVGCAEHSYVPYLPSCHGAHRRARSCSSPIRQLARSRRSPRVMLWTTELRGRASRPMATAPLKAKIGRRRRSG